MRPRRIATAPAAVFVVAALVLVGCDRATDDDPSVATDAEGTQDEAADADDGAAEGDAPDDTGEASLPVSTSTLEPRDAARSIVDIRVAEIIVEFDGEVTDEGTLLTLEEPILFDFDSDRLKAGAREALDDIAEVLAYYPDAPVQVLGHTDDQGSDEYNLGLSQRRADAVAAALVERGIPADRFTAEGRGLTEPVASNETEEGRAANRRVEVLIVGVEPPASSP